MRDGEFELDLALDGIKEAIKVLTTAIEAHMDKAADLEEVRRTLFEAGEAIIAAGNIIFSDHDEPDGSDEANGMVF